MRASASLPLLLLLTLAPACGSGGGTTPAPAPGTPALTAVAPNEGPLAGSIQVTLTGAGFSAGVNGVTFDGVAATNVAVTSDTTCTCTLPARAIAGPVGVGVDVAGTPLLLQPGFTYLGVPTLTSIWPTSGWEPGGTPVRFQGTNLIGASRAARLGGVDCTNLSGGTNEILANAPAGSAGAAVAASVETAGGTASLASAFGYRQYPPAYQVSDVRIDKDMAGAAVSDTPQICCNGANVYAVWRDYRHGNSEIYFNRSTDGGATWLAADVNLSNAMADAFASDQPHMCCDGNRIYVVWQDVRGVPPHLPDIYCTGSTDGGATWSAPSRVNQDAQNANAAASPQVCCGDGEVHVVWSDSRNGALDIYANRSTDDGVTWLLADRRVDTDTAGASQSTSPRICCSGQNVHVLWYDARDGGSSLYVNTSSNRGAAWGGSDTRIDPDSNASAADARICCAGSAVYATWSDTRAMGGYDVHFNRSLDDGGTWGATSPRVNTNTAGASASTGTRLCCDGTNVYVTWSDNRNGFDDIYFNRSTNSGQTWQPTDTRLDTDTAGAAVSIDIQICCGAGTVAVIWCDLRGGAKWDCYVNCSRDGGASWQGSDTRTDTDALAAANSITPQICCDGARLYAIWQDDRNGSADVITNASVP